MSIVHEEVDLPSLYPIDHFVDEATYLLIHMYKYCEACKTDSTSYWRKGWHNDILGNRVHLCNACGIKFRKERFCPYCYVIYNKIEVDPQQCWMACGTCDRWIHTECEHRFRRGLSIEGGIYYCPRCSGNMPPRS